MNSLVNKSYDRSGYKRKYLFLPAWILNQKIIIEFQAYMYIDFLIW